jgi:hypothetical protein
MNAPHLARVLPLSADVLLASVTDDVRIAQSIAHSYVIERIARLSIVLMLGAIAAMCVKPAMADEPGDLIVARDVTPRIAYRPVPTQDDPVAIRVTTFPSSTVDPLMEGLASDLDLGSARGSAGVQGNNNPAAMGAVQAALGVGSQQRGGAPLGAGGQGGGNSIGTTISQTITGALTPLTSGLGNLK